MASEILLKMASKIIPKVNKTNNFFSYSADGTLNSQHIVIRLQRCIEGNLFTSIYSPSPCEEDFLLRLDWALMITNSHHKRRKTMEAQDEDEEWRLVHRLLGYTLCKYGPYLWFVILNLWKNLECSENNYEDFSKSPYEAMLKALMKINHTLTPIFI